MKRQSIEKPSRLIAVSSEDSSIERDKTDRKNKTLMTATDDEEHISPKTCDSYEYARDMSRIMPDITLAETRVNPFVKHHNFTRRQKIKIVVGGLILLPIRVSLITMILLIITPYGCLAYHFIGLSSLVFSLSHDSVVKLKYWLRWPLLWALRLILFILGFYWIETNAKTNKLNAAQLLVAAPHRSVWDAVPYWCVSKLYGNVTVASRHENSRIPILGSLLMLCDPILVKREDAKSRSETRRLIQERSKYQKVLIYPEGTCTNGKHLVEFKTGAFIAGQQVQPIAIEYRLHDRHLDNVTWTWLGLRAWQLIVLTLCVWRTDIIITILPVHKPKKTERQDSHVFARRVAQKLSRQLAVPMSRYSFDDAKLMEMATELVLPRSLACLRFLRLCYALHIEMCLRMSQDEPVPQEALRLQEAQLLADEIDTIDEDDFTSYQDTIIKTITVPDAIIQMMRDFTHNLHHQGYTELDMLAEITSRHEFVDALNINTKYSAKVIKTSVIDYLIKALRCDTVYSINLLNILLLMVLCDVRESNLAMRILTCMKLMSAMNRLTVTTTNTAPTPTPTTTAATTATTATTTTTTTTATTTTTTTPTTTPTTVVNKSTTTNVDGVTPKRFTPMEAGQAEHAEQSSNRSLEGCDGLSTRSIGSDSPQQRPGSFVVVGQANQSSDERKDHQGDDDSICINFEQFQFIIWLLLGIENLDKNCFPDSTSFSYDYVIDNLKNWFTRAVSENLPYAHDLSAQKAKLNLANSKKPTSRTSATGNIAKGGNKFLELVHDFEL